MRKLLASLLVFSAVFGNTQADEISINPDVPERYVVVKGDTLWDISETFLEDPWKWEDIWYQNPQIENPHLIYPGDVIALILVNGDPRLTVVGRGDSANTLKIEDNGTVKLRPAIRSMPIFGAIPAISRQHIESFLNGNRILEGTDHTTAPYIIAGTDGRTLFGAGDRVYGRGNFQDDFSQYQFYRIGKQYIDPDTEEVLGYEAINLGDGKKTETLGELSTFEILRSNQQINAGDRILEAINNDFENIFYPSEPPVDLQGIILDVATGVQNIGQFDIILLNVGSREGVKDGNVFKILHQGSIVLDPITEEEVTLPNETAGLAMVFKTFDKLSYALVLNATQAMKVGDIVMNPEL